MLSNYSAGSKVLAELGGPRREIAHDAVQSSFLIEEADERTLAEFAALRHAQFVDAQGLFESSDHDDADDDPRTITLVALNIGGGSERGVVIGGVRVHSVGEPDGGWWRGSRLVTDKGADLRVGAALVRAACSRAEADGAIRFDACVQADKERFFARLGWQRIRNLTAYGTPHVLMHWPIDTFAKAAEHKSAIGRLVADITPGGSGWIGDDGAPVPGTDVVIVNDAILPTMVERDPWWAGWCSILVNVNDLTAMGATPTGLLDSIGARTESLAERVLAGMQAASNAWGVGVLGGHTQLGVNGALSVTMVGRTDRPIPGGGAKPGQRLSLVADLAGQWRRGYTGRQWDSTSTRTPDELRAMQELVARLNPAAAKDVSMAGVVGTAAMLAEASDASVVIDIDAVPKPATARLDQWLSCFPGYAMLIAHDDPLTAGNTRTCIDTIDELTIAEIGQIRTGSGVELRWPDGYAREVVGGCVTGLGPSGRTTPTLNKRAGGTSA